MGHFIVNAICQSKYSYHYEAASFNLKRLIVTLREVIGICFWDVPET